VGLFPLTPDARRYFLGAAVAAARALGLEGAAGVDACAARLGLCRTHRLRALADLLALEDGWRAEPSSLPPGGWGELAAVIRRDRPLDAGERLVHFHAHLAAVGHDDARAMATRLAALPEAARGLVDLGAGAGHYAAAFLDAAPSAQATLVDRAEVQALVAPRARQRLIAGDLLDLTAAGVAPHGIALLANVVHLYDATDGARLCAEAAARADVVVVKDLWIELDHSGPPASLYFALNMALFTDGGEVHPAARIAGWLGAAGLGEPRIERHGDEVIVWARR
jgi:hypothetical protein